MPKTDRNIYENAVSFENLLLAHKKARCGKREKKMDILIQILLLKFKELLNIIMLELENYQELN